MRYLKILGTKIWIYKVVEDTQIKCSRPEPTKWLSIEKSYGKIGLCEPLEALINTYIFIFTIKQ